MKAKDKLQKATKRASETVMMLSMFCGNDPRGYIQFLPRVLHFSAVHFCYSLCHSIIILFTVIALQFLCGLLE